MISYLVALSFSPRAEEDGHNDELKDATEDKDHTNEHPDIQEGDVRNTGYILSNLKEDKMSKVGQINIFLPS